MKKKTPSDIAASLREYQQWRKGIGKYEWNEEPAKNEECPFKPEDLSKIEDMAIGCLESMQGAVMFYRNALESILQACSKPFGKDARMARRIATEALENGVRV